jgi:hypothetical protein
MTQKEIFVMVFYSVLTWFLAPMLAQKYKYSKEVGFVSGFVLSMILYHLYGREFISKSY